MTEVRDRGERGKMKRGSGRIIARRWIALSLALLLVSLVILPGCAQFTSEVAQNRLKLAGSTTVEPVAHDAAELFMTRYPAIEITVRGGGSTIGVKGIAYEALHIGMASRSIKSSEMEKWPDLQATVIGRDGVAVVVNKSLYNDGVTKLTLGQIADIWLGNITNWQEVGGPNLEILAYDKEIGRGTRDIFGKTVFGDSDAEAPGTVGALGENEAVMTTISQNKGAISIISTGWQTSAVVGVAIVADDGNAVAPTKENVASGQYPISRELNLITSGPPQGTAREFIEFILSPEGQRFVEDNGYVPAST